MDVRRDRCRKPDEIRSRDCFALDLKDFCEVVAVTSPDTAWAVAYPNVAAPTDEDLTSATSQAIEILLRDNVAHAEAPSDKGVARSRFRQTALARLTFREMRDQLRSRYVALAEKMRVACENA